MFWLTLLFLLLFFGWTALVFYLGWRSALNWDLNRFLAKLRIPPREPPEGARV